MYLKPVECVEEISPEDFKNNYYFQKKPLIIKGLSKNWPAYQKWNWDYFIELIGEKKVGVYNNIKSDSYTPINTADDQMLIADYLRKVKQGPLQLRIFLFNLFKYAPGLTKDFIWPDHLMNGFIKKYPMLFIGGEGSVTHIHFDIDMSHILHTQFIGRKRVLLFPFEEQYKLYRKPFEVLSMADFTNYKQNFNYKEFPATRLAKGYEVVMEHGDTLFLPSGYWHHMEYLDSGFALSLRAINNDLSGKILGVWRLFGMRNIDTLLKKTFPLWWYKLKVEMLMKNASNELKKETVSI